ATGIAKDFNSALMKSLSEVGEILLLKEGFESTEGIAGGVLTWEAKKRSVNEYLERELIRWHLKTETPFGGLRSVEKNGVMINIRPMAIMDSKSFGFIGYYKNDHEFNFSSVLNEDENEAIEHLIVTLYQASRSGSLLYEKSYLNLLE